MFNTLSFPEGKQLLRNALPVAKNIERLKARFHKKKLPVIYVNDNFGQWREDWREVRENCLNSLGKPLAEILEPTKDDFFVLKPKHSAFYCTTLDLMLSNLKAKRLVITGIAGNICVLFTVNDAHMRGFEIVVPSDCVASNTKRDNAYALQQFRDVFGIQTQKGDFLSLSSSRKN